MDGIYYLENAYYIANTKKEGDVYMMCLLYLRKDGMYGLIEEGKL